MSTYAIVLYPDKKGMLKLMNLIAGNFMFDYNIKPHITLAVFESRSELRAKYFFKQISADLKPARLYYHAITFRSDMIYVRSRMSENLSYNMKRVCDICKEKFELRSAVTDPAEWAPGTAVSYKLGKPELLEYSLYILRAFRAFDCTSHTAALVRLDPYTELSVVKLRFE